jgi:putative ABC transport system substrate-binding protein
MWKKLYPPLTLIFLLSLILISLLSVDLSSAQQKKGKGMIWVGVTQIVSTPALEEDQRGFEKALAEAGFKEKIKVIYDRQNAQGNLANAQAIAQKFLVEKFDLIHCLTAPASQEVVKLIRDIPVVFSSVTDPVGAGLVPRNSRPGTKSGTNVTGVSHRWPVHLQIEMYTRFVPKAKKWGTIYNASDSSSLVQIKEVREATKKLGIELMEATVSSDAETIQAAEFLVGKVHAIYIAYDYTVLSAFEAVVRVCNERKIPLFTSDGESVAVGAIAAYGLNFFAIGHSAGKRAVRILKGEKPGAIPWGRVDKLSLVVNEKAARAQGIIIPSELLKKSDKII